MAKTTPSADDDADGVSLGPVERTLAAMFVGIIALSVVAFLLLMIGSAGGWLDGPLYILVFYIPFIGLPVALLLVVALMVRIGLRRARANRHR